MKTALIVAGALTVGFVLGISSSAKYIRSLRKQLRERRGRKPPVSILRSVTNLLFVTSQLAALVWVSISYAIALYSTIELAQPFPVEELSRQAIITLIGVTALKVVQNIFEHNNGGIFGTSKQGDDYTPPEDYDQEGMG